MKKTTKTTKTTKPANTSVDDAARDAAARNRKAVQDAAVSGGRPKEKRVGKPREASAGRDRLLDVVTSVAPAIMAVMEKASETISRSMESADRRARERHDEQMRALELQIATIRAISESRR